MRSTLLALGVVLIYFSSCSPVKFVKPLQKNEQVVTASLGGPLIKYGSLTIPVPFITAGYGYGFDSTLAGFSSLNITSALYGNFQAELGVTKLLLSQKKHFPGVSLSPVVNIIYRNKNAAKVYPQLAANVFWEYGKRKNLFYFSADNWFELSSKRAYERDQPNRWILMPSIGHSFNHAKWNFIAELKSIAPNRSNEKLVVDYVTPFGSKGAFGVYFGTVYKF
jgi:hypothetical protein